MKKLLIILISAFSLMIFTETNSYSVEFIAGAKIWYVNWMPWLRDAGQTAEDRYFGFQNVELGNGLMYGVSGSLRITDEITASVSYLYGVLDSNFEHEDRGWIRGESGLEDKKFRQVGSAEIKRHDLDSALAYSVLSWFKVFAGYKYQPLKIKIKQEGVEKIYTPASRKYTIMKQNLDMQNHCPAIGVGVSKPLSDVFVFNFNLSALYLTGTTDYSLEINSYTNADLDTPGPTQNISAEMKQTGWGCNVEPSVVAIIGGDILIVLGFRYQVVMIDAIYKDKEQGTETPYSNMKDHVFGAYLNVMYRFI